MALGKTYLVCQIFQKLLGLSKHSTVAEIQGAVCWRSNLQDILWIRNQIVAPISEEFTFRACMLPQLLKCYANSSAIIVSPLFFGVGKTLLPWLFITFLLISIDFIGHFHHMIERWRLGMSLGQSLLISCNAQIKTIQVQPFFQLMKSYLPRFPVYLHNTFWNVCCFFVSAHRPYCCSVCGARIL